LPAAAAPPKPSPLRPPDYGVYAVVEDKSLAELQLLPGRAPDIRVAVSAAFKVPDQADLPNGHPKFIVFRRDALTNILERAEVRVVAKIAREFSVEASGKKPETDDAWVIRNASYPFRASPVPDNPEMYELHGEDPRAGAAAGPLCADPEGAILLFRRQRRRHRPAPMHRTDRGRQRHVLYRLQEAVASFQPAMPNLPRAEALACWKHVRGGTDAYQIPGDRCDSSRMCHAGAGAGYAEDEQVTDHPIAHAGGHAAEQQPVQQSDRTGRAAGGFRQPQSERHPDLPSALTGISASSFTMSAQNSLRRDVDLDRGCSVQMQ
jgi:hypothetical protein